MKKPSLLAAFGILLCSATAGFAGPVLHYNFNQVGAVQQSTGSKERDLTVLNYNAQQTNYVTLAPSQRFGDSINALNFTAANVDGGLGATNITKGAAQASLSALTGDGSGADSFLQDGLGSFTITAWVLHSASTNTDVVMRRIFSLRNGASQPIIDLSVSTPSATADQALYLTLSGSEKVSHEMSSTLKVPANSNAWYFVSVSYDQETGQVKFYLGEEGGVLSSTTGSNVISGKINTLLQDANLLSIGNVGQQHQRRLDGYLADVSFYDAALSAQEVENLHAIPEPTVSFLLGAGLLLAVHRSWKLRTQAQ